MTATLTPRYSTASQVLAMAARWILGALFVYMGLHKALHPVEFLKLLRQYDVLQGPFFLNFVAATLPWFEIFCGLLLILGIAVRGTAFMLVAMLLPFTAVILMRALALHQAGGLPFCMIKFDCGCGAGEVFICRKLAENFVLTLVSVGLIFGRWSRFSLRPNLFPSKEQVAISQPQVNSEQ
jgi:uncharacterized membrane protein YphA (DoxX/SURF4 family)